MPTYRYVLRGGAAANSEGHATEVAVANEADKAELDATMERIGYAFECAVPADAPTVLAPRASDRTSPFDAPWWRWAAPTGAVTIAAVVQSAVFQHELRGDDYLHLFAAVHHGWKEVLTPYAGHVIPIHKVAYALLWRAFGVWSAPYFALAFVTHLLCVFLLYRLVLRLSGSPIWSAFWATAWGTSLVCASTMNMFACYGGVLCTAPALWVAEDVLHASDDGELPSAGRIAIWTAAVLFSALTFGVRMVAVLAMPLTLALAYVRQKP